MIGEDYLIRISGKDDLSDVTELKLLVNSGHQSLLFIADFIPSLQSLSLDNSVILTVRDLGTGLRNLSYLSMNGCGLRDIDGIGALSGLQVRIYLFTFTSL